MLHFYFGALNYLKFGKSFGCVNLLTYFVREVIGSNFSRDTSYPDCDRDTDRKWATRKLPSPSTCCNLDDTAKKVSQGMSIVDTSRKVY
jgi:hypothetical protein